MSTEPTSTPPGHLPPIRREILVDADPATAFEVFTERIGQWWPLEDLSVYGPGGTVGFAEGQIVEQSASGDATVWGTVYRWEPAAALAFSWHPGGPPDQASHVEVTFTQADAQTLVTLTHTGWERFTDPAEARAEYDQGWPVVLGTYRDHVARHAPDDSGLADGGPDAGGETWVALLHRPGPAAPDGAALFDDPRFAEHVAFLTRMRDADYLVAAGPLTDVPGEGMTILRLPGAGQLDRATELATKEDSSVAGGFFTVTVRPWQVMFQAGR
ncbi:MAG: SRPBCC domain-containing protein [Streptosporangiaceae bacterium]